MYASDSFRIFASHTNQLPLSVYANLDLNVSRLTLSKAEMMRTLDVHWSHMADRPLITSGLNFTSPKSLPKPI